MFEHLGFLESVNPAPEDGPGRTATEVFARAAAAERQSEVAEQAEAEARRAAALDRAEALALTNRALGDPLGEISRAQAAAARASDEVADLETKLAKARSRLASAQGNVQFHAERMQAAQDCARRSVTEDLFGPAKEALAGLQADMAAQRVERMLAARPVSRPKGSVSRSRGGAVRSEHCIWCTEAGATDEESYLLHSDPELNVPVTAPGSPEAQAEHAKRRTRGGRQAMIYR